MSPRDPETARPSVQPAPLIDRRAVLQAGAALSMAALAGGGIAPAMAAWAAPGEFSLPPLPYPPNAIEPVIDAQTMEIHHGKHHAAYVTNLNAALAKSPELLSRPIEELLARDGAIVPEAARQAVINNGGGHANHSLFWSILGPPKDDGAPSGKLAEAIQSTFGSLATMQEKINEAGTKRFGSGWTWLVRNAEGKLDVLSTANQDSPLMKGMLPLLGIDVWEHAYYLKYQNRRADYLKAIWKAIQWPAVAQRFGAEK